MDFRPAVPADAEDIFDMFVEDKVPALLSWESASGFASLIRRNPRQAWVCEIEGSIVGYVFIADGHRGVFQHLHVKESERKQSIATQLVQAALLDYDSRTGVSRFQAVVTVGNEIGKHFWLSLGFRIRSGEGGKTILMVKDLS